ncbi:M64 family metallopeptidase [Capnocytophaga sp.]|uniref:M64 family metallopeptidase n=1 Tax=Capnocytophaga sp. TaxID=44737 RepID=UPI0026DD8315|nr:M64 family metallopeptidase [Capnocytophaga sp.]MDO5104907.1 M64 family metallopeptidase [Capnocytophaga sp.]
MQRFFCILFFLAGFQLNAKNEYPFDFSKSLRIDFYILGDATTAEVIVSQLKKEPHWGGSKTNLIFPDFGELRVRLIDENTGKIVFSKGFNSLFNEWQHVEQAKTEKKMFLHAIQFPFPTKKLKFSIEKRNKEGRFDDFFQKTINPDDYFIKEETVLAYPVKKILENGDASQKVDLVILAEGYTQNEMAKFYADAKRMTDYMFTIPPFDALKQHFNVYAVGVPSQESGTDIPGKNSYKKTAFDASFYTFDMERYLTTNNMQAIADAASLVPYDQIYILVNTETYGGGGFYNHLNLATSDNKLSEKVFVHEFGHGFAGLADEYYDSSTAFDSAYNIKVEPWEQNITSLVNFDTKWKDMIKKTTPIPTPRTSKYEKTVGVFEGGGYVSKGIYSPVQDCRMKSNDPKGFCPVCQRAIHKVVKFYTE